MKTIIAFLLVLFTVSAAYADNWADEPNRINKTIDDTNYIVEGHCTGTLIDAKLRLVLTNFHCIDDNVTQKTNPEVWQTRKDNFDILGRNQYVTNIVAMSKSKDVAVLQIRDQSLKWVPTPKLAFQVARGERVYIVGNPAMLEASVVEGIISNRNRTIGINGEPHDYLQFSGGIFGGNSGGALYNRFGQLVAIPSAGLMQAPFLGFGIPMSVVSEVLEDNCISVKIDGSVEESSKCPAQKSKLIK